ncbi:hypothetical protein NUW58_g5874 [Xylaria curta]|uniref:Uncharacterized protein n=1 Tax=Xylaria curta TaxID=42375 RepID=A0ACC1P2J7_9PEZI|nr:hypothetical protein NUW58_g5874 [Xylaria curta]
MATQGGLFDTKTLAEEILVEILKGFGGGDVASLAPEITTQLQDLVQTHLKAYNKQYNDAFSKYQKCVEDSQKASASYIKQIRDLERDLEEEKALGAEQIRHATENAKKERDEVSRRADQERVEMEKKEEDREAKRIKDKAAVDRAIKDARDARGDIERAEAALIQAKEKENALKAKIASLEAELQEARAEAKGWEGETEKTTNLKEQAEQKLSRCQLRLEPMQQKNLELKLEVKKLRTELRGERQIRLTQAADIDRLQEQLDDRTEQLQDLRARFSREATPVGGENAARAGLGSTRDSDSETGSRRSTGSRWDEAERERNRSQQLSDQLEAGRQRIEQLSDDLERGRERYQQLEERIADEYISRSLHQIEVEDLRVQRDNQTANNEINVERIRVLQDASRGHATEVRDLGKKIRALEASGRTCESENAQRKTRILELESLIRLGKERIDRMEKAEREQRAKIAKQEAEIAELRNRIRTAAESDQGLQEAAEQLREETEEKLERCKAENGRIGDELKDLREALAEAEAKRDRFENHNQGEGRS